MTKRKLDLHKKYGCKIVSMRRKAELLDKIVSYLADVDSIYYPWNESNKNRFAEMVNEETVKLYWD